MIFSDRAEIAGIEERGGRLFVNARVARGGNVQDYLGSEVGRPDMKTVKVFRPADEVFNTDSAQSYAHAVVTLDHPNGRADFDRDAVGWLGDEVMRDGEFIRVPMVVGSRKAIDAVKGGKRELSVGYQCDLVWGDGVAPSGEVYQAKQTQIVVDHVAIVSLGRAGHDCRIGDGRNSERGKTAPKTKGGRSMADENLVTVMVDGLTIHTTDQESRRSTSFPSRSQTSPPTRPPPRQR